MLLCLHFKCFISWFYFCFQPSTEGFIAIVLPKLGECEPQMENLLSSSEYDDILQTRTTDQNIPTGWQSYKQTHLQSICRWNIICSCWYVFITFNFLTHLQVIPNFGPERLENQSIFCCFCGKPCFSQL